jgi:hypothetical protein
MAQRSAELAARYRRVLGETDAAGSTLLPPPRPRETSSLELRLEQIARECRASAINTATQRMTLYVAAVGTIFALSASTVGELSAHQSHYAASDPFYIFMFYFMGLVLTLGGAAYVYRNVLNDFAGAYREAILRLEHSWAALFIADPAYFTIVRPLPRGSTLVQLRKFRADPVENLRWCARHFDRLIELSYKLADEGDEPAEQQAPRQDNIWVRARELALCHHFLGLSDERMLRPPDSRRRTNWHVPAPRETPRPQR